VGKLAAVALLAMLLLIPLGMIQDQIAQRGRYQKRVTEEIAGTAAGRQTWIGPLLAIRYRTQSTERFRDTNTGEIVSRENEQIAFVPARTLAIEGRADVERRYRGIYQARLFHLDLMADGEFSVPAEIVEGAGEIVEAHAVMLLGISDLRGVDAEPEALIDQRSLRFSTPKDKRFDAILPGSRLELDLGALTPGEARRIRFSLPLRLTGTESFSLAPTAENNSLRLQSGWRHPSFQGRFLPRSREVSDDGFGALWEVSQLARDLKKTLDPHTSEVLSVAFLDPVNIYLQSERAVKYGSLFIALTFAAFFLGEVLRRRPMHILQYLLVGLSLAIFFLLLIALSEHLPFLSAYLVSAGACIGLIVFYLAGAFDAWRPAFAFGAGLTGLYAMLYVILQLEDKALLMGSLLLFAALAAIMLGTRRFDWYGWVGENKDAPRFRERQTWASAGEEQ
ncbi:MAG: cell envelope integrity protein CreD, partial [Candidatus Accumulibacter sp.]|nr:cell envelope integrity protein CreD [Accumulibacter sp.]